ncbi:MAG: hypothetical protein JWN53_545, partial [Gemmatimonadetes bacterium]|nr:hypothetical protein [Gemmatimonadota bacterium]
GAVADSLASPVADRIAQLVEQETFNLQVVGSIPTPVIIPV